MKILYGWKEIANYLNVSANTLKCWHKRKRIPLKKTSESKQGAVYVAKSDLENWFSNFSNC